MSLLTCRHLSVSYDGKAVLSDLNFSVDEGDYLGIVGENGAGKSTLVKALLRLKNIGRGNRNCRWLQAYGNRIPSQQTPVQKDFPASVWEVVLSGRLNRCGMYPLSKIR
ncbi:MAG: ATP-binding cassette domain-containing protein [Dialister invisus]